MNLNDYGVVMHIDTSAKLYERKHTGIAFKIIGSNNHKGIGLHIRLKKELERDFGVNDDYARLYAICIYYLIKGDLDNFDTLVICGDEHFLYVKGYLDLLFQDNNSYFKKNIISIKELRNKLDDQNFKSPANNIANSYRKRALKQLSRQQKGVPLNIVKINYARIQKKWLEI